MEKNVKDGSPRNQRVTILYSGQRTFSDRATFEQKAEGEVKEQTVKIYKSNVPGRGGNQCKDPEF